MTPDIATRLRARLAPGIMLCSLGLALLLGSDWLVELAVTPRGSVPQEVLEVSQGLTVVAAFLLIAIRRRKTGADLTNLDPSHPSGGFRTVFVILGLAAAAGKALTYLQLLAPGTAGGFVPLDAIALLGTLICAVAKALLLLAWLAFLCGDLARNAPVVIPLAYVFTALLFFAARLVPDVVATVLLVLLPLASALVLARMTERVTPGISSAGASGDAAGASDVTAGNAADAGDDTKAPIVEALVPDAVATKPQTWSFPVRPVALMAIYVFVFYFTLSLSHGPNPYGPFGMLAIALIALVVALLAKRAYSPTFLYKLALPLMLAGLMVLAYLDTGRAIAVMFTNSGNTAFTLFILIALVTTCHRYDISPWWVFGIVEACSSFASMVGMPLGRLFTQAYPVGSETNGLVICVVCVGMVALGVIFFNDRLADSSFGLTPITNDGERSSGGVLAAMTYNERVVWSCSQVARANGLTQREQEVLELMVQGLTANDIAERTCVSYGTVKTHINHIYKKLDVHSRDEAVAIVQEPQA